MRLSLVAVAATVFAILTGCSTSQGTIRFVYGAAVGSTQAVRTGNADMYDGPDTKTAKLIDTMKQDDKVLVLEEPVEINEQTMVKVRRQPFGPEGFVKMGTISNASLKFIPDAPKPTPETPSPAPTSAPYAEGALLTVAVENAQIIKEAKLGSEKVAAPERGTVLRVTGKPVTDGGITWIPVELVNVKPPVQGFIPTGAVK